MEEEHKNDICRVCLNCDFDSKPGENLSLFEKYNDCMISDKMNALTNIGITEGDGLPDKICPTCLLELESAFEFKVKCEKNNEILLSAVNNVSTQLKSEDDDLSIKDECIIDDNFNVPTPLESDDTSLSMKEEYLDDDNNTDGDENIPLADLQAADADIKPFIEPPRPSKAIDLKLECHDCGGSFKSKCKLRVHWKKVHMTEQLKCPNCLSKFKSYAAYNSHKKRKLTSCVTASKVRIEGEGKHRVFHCKDCIYHSERISDMSAHIVIHSGERPFQCDICLRSFTQHSSLSSHKEASHKVYIAEGTCHYCGKHIQGRTKLYRHMEQHRRNNFPCKICSIVLKSKSSFKNHMKRHSGIKAYACEICPKSFYTQSELCNHKTKVHLKTKTYKCEICDYTTSTSSALKTHQPKHSASNAGCNVCGMFFDNDLQLTLHKKRHTDRRYQCPHCEKKYYSGKNLSAHVRIKHRIVKLSGRGPAFKVNCVKSECPKAKK
ncbi:putative zinc finger protein 45-like protein [Operophtera brumata]|uniref:Putative zinc finger protein 45-like protein n=1 Tax=Operophtera brumata TaxID=104452 RepID=A0A0L7KW38_OPEBR|nr:putative zinc finger protein 45-like protein [Operophtera brumata]